MNKLRNIERVALPILLVLMVAAIVIIPVIGLITDKAKEKIMTEWVSPDGVHYWMCDSSRKNALAPRYDHDGNLVIDK